MSEQQGNEELSLASVERRIRFVKEAVPGDVVLMRFADPAPWYAVLAHEADAESLVSKETLNITIVPSHDARQALVDRGDVRAAADGMAPTYVRYRGVELQWQPVHAVLLCDPEQVDSLLPAIIEFSHYESQLRQVEQEIAAAWSELEQDNTLAFDVTSADLRRSDVVGARMERAFLRRIRFARIEPHLGSPDASMPIATQKLGEELREKTAVETRAEAVDGQLEVFEHIYEMTSQRMGEYKAARQGHIMEWVIIVLLGAEALLMLLQTLLRPHG
jgi:hypothetical protein